MNYKRTVCFYVLFCLYFTLSKNPVLLRKCANTWKLTLIWILVIVSKPGYEQNFFEFLLCIQINFLLLVQKIRTKEVTISQSLTSVVAWFWPSPSITSMILKKRPKVVWRIKREDGNKERRKEGKKEKKESRKVGKKDKRKKKRRKEGK